MAERCVAGSWVEVDDGGYLVDPLAWTPEVAEALAREAGIDRLTAAHWTVLSAYREALARHGEPPALHGLAVAAGLALGDLHRLFAGRPDELVGKIAGRPHPQPSPDPSGSFTGGAQGDLP